MYFEPTGIYHIYNQGNNRQKIFFERENYYFFLRKIYTHVLPYSDILAYCLMPNHFHLMINVNAVELQTSSPGATSSRTRTATLNASIGVMLASYTRAINIQENRTGSLFRKESKAICLNERNGITPTWYSSYGTTIINVEFPEFQYPQTCFDYIHNNPVAAGIVEKPEDWEFSSYNDLRERKYDGMVNLKKVEEFDLTLH